MPAQEEEIEAAEREGITILAGLAPTEVVGRDGRRHGAPLSRSSGPTGAAGARARRVRGGPGRDPRDSRPATILVAIGEEPDPSILPEGAGIEVSGWAGIVADPRTLATGRAGIFAGGDVVSGPKTIIDAVAAGRRAAASIHEYLAGARRRRSRDHGRRPLQDRTRAIRCRSTSRPGRAHTPPLPVVQLGSFAATQAGFDEDRSPRRGLPLLPLRRRLRLPQRRRSWPGAARTRPSARSQPHRPRPRRRSRSQEVICNDTRPGIWSLRRRRGVRRGHDRRGPRRPVAAGAGAPPRRGRTWPPRPASSPSAWAPTCGGSSTSPARHLHSCRSSSAASSSSTRTS